MAVLVGRVRTALCLLLTAAVFCAAADAYLAPPSSVLREQMVSRFGKPAGGHLSAWQQSLQGLGATPVSEPQTLAAVNALANRAEYLSDTQNWGQQDYWATPAEFVAKNAGDCEDYVIAKYYTLRALGIAAERLRLVYTRALFQGRLVPHMVLAWYPSADAEPMLLDNIDPRLLPASQRPDLSPVFSFNDKGVWRRDATPGAREVTTPGPWRALQERVLAEMQL